MEKENDYQITIDMLMSKEEQTRIGINPDDVEHERDFNQVLCRILEEYDNLRKRLETLGTDIVMAQNLHDVPHSICPLNMFT